MPCSLLTKQRTRRQASDWFISGAAWRNPTTFSSCLKLPAWKRPGSSSAIPRPLKLEKPQGLAMASTISSEMPGATDRLPPPRQAQPAGNGGDQDGKDDATYPEHLKQHYRIDYYAGHCTGHYRNPSIGEGRFFGCPRRF